MTSRSLAIEDLNVRPICKTLLASIGDAINIPEKFYGTEFEFELAIYMTEEGLYIHEVTGRSVETNRVRRIEEVVTPEKAQELYDSYPVKFVPVAEAFAGVAEAGTVDQPGQQQQQFPA